MPDHPGRHETSADASLGFDDALDYQLDRAIIRPRRQACPEDARTKRMSVRLTFCQPWVARLPPWSMRPWESPPPMRWRGGTNSHGRMDHRGSSHKLVKSSLMRVPMCRTRDARAPVPNSLRAPGWRRHDARVSAGARPENHGSSADLRASGWRRHNTRFRADARPGSHGSSADLRAPGWRRQGMRVRADARPEKHKSTADPRAGWMPRQGTQVRADARPEKHGSTADLRAGRWRRDGTRFRTDARPDSRGSSTDLRAPGWRRHGTRVRADARPEKHGSAADLRAGGWRGTQVASCSAGQPRIKCGPSRRWMAPARHAGQG